MLPVSHDSFQCLRGNDDCFGGRLSDCLNGFGHQRFSVLSHLQPGQLLNQRMVSAASCLALGHEIPVRQQFRPVLLQEPLDRSRARFVRADVDMANTRCHARIVALSGRCEQ